MNVIGLDLSLNGTGISCGDHTNFTVIGKLSQGDGRLVAIADAVRYYAIQGDGVRGRTELAMIEGLPFGNNDRAVALVHGAARTALARLTIPFVYVYPTTLKTFAVGKGKAEKSEMMAAAVALGANARIDSDQADAWWLRRMGLAALRQVGFTPEQAAVMGHVQGLAAHDPLRVDGKAQEAKCRDNIYAMRNGDHWLHPFDMAVCTKPPARK
jgi:hypothetical protein